MVLIITAVFPLPVTPNRSAARGFSSRYIASSFSNAVICSPTSLYCGGSGTSTFRSGSRLVSTSSSEINPRFSSDAICVLESLLSASRSSDSFMYPSFSASISRSSLCLSEPSLSVPSSNAERRSGLSVSLTYFTVFTTGFLKRLFETMHSVSSSFSSTVPTRSPNLYLSVPRNAPLLWDI